MSKHRERIESQLKPLLLDFENANSVGDEENAAWAIVMLIQGRTTRYLYWVFGPLDGHLDDVFHDFILHFMMKVVPKLNRREGPLLPFVFKCAKHFTLDQIRKLNRENRRMRQFEEDDSPDNYEDVRAESFTEVETDLTKLLGLLPSRTDREILVLRYGEEYTLREIAQILSLPASTICRRSQAAMKTLRNSCLIGKSYQNA